MSDFDDRDALAAEYVLGTLDSEERAGLAARIEADAEFAARVRDWERRLGALNSMVDEVEPAPAVWEKIRASLGEDSGKRDFHLPDIAPAWTTAAAGEGTEIIALSRQVGRWRGAATGLAAIAALLAVFVAIGEIAPGRLRSGGGEVARTPRQPQSAPGTTNAGRFVAVLQRDASSPAFLLTVDTDTRMLTVRRVAAEQESGKSYQLWLVSDRLPAPQSLGLVGRDEFTQMPLKVADDANLMNAATYAVSLEPEGGSPTGTPTGPVMYRGTLMEAMPPAAKP